MSFPGPKLPGRLSGWLHGAAKAALDIVYPQICAACERALLAGPEATRMETCFCASCAKDLPWVQPPYCQRCGEAYDGAVNGPFRCGNCEGVPYHFEFATAACPAEGAVREMIHRFKYERQLHLRRPLSILLERALEEPRLAREDLGGWLLVPVPLHAERERVREYNQSWELCRRLTLHTGIPAQQALVRVRETTTQASLSRRERQKNLHDAFEMLSAPRWRPAPDVRGRSVLLVDDVFTTGSTASECARVLRKKGGAARVVVITVARG